MEWFERKVMQNPSSNVSLLVCCLWHHHIISESKWKKKSMLIVGQSSDILKSCINIVFSFCLFWPSNWKYIWSFSFPSLEMCIFWTLNNRYFLIQHSSGKKYESKKKKCILLIKFVISIRHTLIVWNTWCFKYIFLVSFNKSWMKSYSRVF